MSDLSVVDRISAFNRGRDPVLVARKYALMRSGPFSFLRGTCHLFYSMWPSTPLVDAAPVAWISGDLHVENLGTYKGDNRLTYFDLNDFDEAILAPGLWDIARLLTSILVETQQWKIRDAEALAIVRQVRDEYCAELRTGHARWIERETARGIVKRLLAQVTGRSRTELLNFYTRTTGKRRRFVPDGQRLLPISADERIMVERIVKTIAGIVGDESFFRVLDVARRVAGIGSLGCARYVVLIEGDGSPHRNVLLDVKQAAPSSLAPYVTIQQPQWPTEATRIVQVQQHAVAVPPALLQAVSIDETSYVVRELQPTADRLHLVTWKDRPKKLCDAFTISARLAAWSLYRASGWHTAATADTWESFAARDDWQAPLLERVRDASVQTLTAYRDFAEAYDAGALSPLERDPLTQPPKR